MGNLIFRIILFCSALFLCSCDNKEEHLKTAIKQYNNRDFKEALYNFEKACLEGQIYACKMTASIYLEGKGVPKSKAKSLKALEYACKWGDTSSCKIAYHSYHALKLDTLAKQMLEYGCQGGDAKSCTNLSLTSYKSQDTSTALTLAYKACYGGDLRGCTFYLALGEKHKVDTQKLNAIKKQIAKLNEQKQ